MFYEFLFAMANILVNRMSSQEFTDKSEAQKKDDVNQQGFDGDLSEISIESFFEANGIDIDELTTFSEQAKKAMEGEPEALLDLPHDEVMEELREKQKKIEEAFNKIIKLRDEILSKLRDEKAKRDDFNNRVRELAAKIRELVEKRNELQKYVDEKKQELNTYRQTLRELSNKLELLQREIEGFSLRKERRIKAQIRKYEMVLERFNIPPDLEEKLIAKIKELSEQLRSFKEKEEKWKELNKLRRERERLRDSIGALRKALVLYVQELNKIKSEIRELRKERDFYKSKADEHHMEVQKCVKKLEFIKEALDKLRDVRYKISKTLSKLRRLKYQMRQFRVEEEFKQVVLKRLTEIKSRIERGELEMPDLQFLINFGFLTEDIFEKIASTSPQELAKKVAEELGYTS